MDIVVNYKHLFNYDINNIKNILEESDDSIWKQNTERQKSFLVHSNTESIVYVWSDFTDSNYNNVKQNSTLNNKLNLEVHKIAEQIRKSFSESARITKLMLVKLKKGSYIPSHIDGGNLQKIHRCHLPIITDKSCIFTIDNIDYFLKQGSVVEINNQKQHSVYSGNVNRIHLICDVLDT